MRKKYPTTSKDKKDWIAFTKRIDNISPKEADLLKQSVEINKIKKLDLHGSSLIVANKIVKKFIIKSFNNGCKKLLIVTGKGLRSRVYNNPYLSERTNVLKHTVPEFIKNDKDLFDKISRMSKADLKEGGEGAFCVFLKQTKKSIE